MIRLSRITTGEADRLVSVVLPLYNEAAVLETLVERVSAALTPTGHDFEIIFVNDGSTDEGPALLDRLAQRDPRVRVVHFARNFGHQAAVQAGLAHARGDAVVVMDSDLQDDPAAIPGFLEKWEEGYQVVYAVRVQRKEGWFKRLLFAAFYRGLNAVSNTPMPLDAGNFGLLDRQVAAQVASLLDRDRYFAGLRRWVGFRQIGVPVERAARHDDRPRVSLRGLFKLAKSALFSFSSAPLAAFYYIAAACALLALGLAGWWLAQGWLQTSAAPGWTTQLAIAAGFGALNALGVAVLGEYLIRVYDQVRGRPLFIVASRRNFEAAGEPLVESKTPSAGGFNGWN